MPLKDVREVSIHISLFVFEVHPSDMIVNFKF